MVLILLLALSTVRGLAADLRFYISLLIAGDDVDVVYWCATTITVAPDEGAHGRFTGSDFWND